MKLCGVLYGRQTGREPNLFSVTGGQDSAVLIGTVGCHIVLLQQGQRFFVGMSVAVSCATGDNAVGRLGSLHQLFGDGVGTAVVSQFHYVAGKVVPLAQHFVEALLLSIPQEQERVVFIGQLGNDGLVV